MKSRNVLIAVTVAVTMLAAGCSSGGSGGGAQGPLEKTNIVVDAFPAIDSVGLTSPRHRACSPPRACT